MMLSCLGKPVSHVVAVIQYVIEVKAHFLLYVRILYCMYVYNANLHPSGILSDLFPGVCIPEHDYGVLHSTILESLVNRNLQPLPSMTKKVQYK